MQIKDALLRKLAGATDHVALKASGKLTPGNYNIHNVPIKVPDDTAFTIDVTVPFSSATEINCGLATGSMRTSKAITVLGIPAPQQIELKNGAASADVDLARMLITLVLNSLQGLPNALAQAPDQSQSNPLSAILSEVDVSAAEFDFKSGSQLDMPFGKATIGPQSKLQLKNVHFDSQFNYKGDCLIDLALPLLELLDKKQSRDIQFQCAKVKMEVKSIKQGNNIWLELPAAEPNAFAAASMKASDPQAIMTCGACAIKVTRAKCQRTLAGQQSETALAGTVELAKGFLQVHHNNIGVQAIVPMLSGAAFNADTKSGALTYSLIANKATVNQILVKGTSTKGSFDVNLKQTQIEKLSLTRAKGFSLGFGNAVCVPSIVHWASGKKVLLLRFAPGSSMLLNAFSALGDENQINAKIPITVHSGGLHLESAKGIFDCDDLDGTLQLAIQNQDVQSDGKFNLSVRSSNNMLGIAGARATIKGLNSHTDEHQITVDMPDCRLVFPPEQLRQAISANLPKQRVFEVNKTLYQGRKWRYRNFKLDKVTVSNPSLDKLSLAKQGEFNFSGTTDVTAGGTVEKFELHPLSRAEHIQWKQLPWSAKGHVSGTGRVDLKFLPGATLADCKLQYKAALRMPVPDKLVVDWSGVSGDILGNAEQTVIQQVIKNAAFFTPAQGIPIDSVGEIKPFKSATPRLRQIKVRNFTMTPGPDGIAIDLSARAAL